MCNLYTVRKSAAEVAAHFGAETPKQVELADETTPGANGLIVREHNERRLLQSLSWGFPRRTAEMRAKGQKPTRVNLVADLTNPMWSETVQQPRYRCLIPVTEFAEPDGQPGSKTRTWFRVRGEPIFAWAGFCRNTAEFGAVFAGMTSDSNEAVMRLNPRMPTLLHIDEYDRWLHGAIQDVIGFQFRKYPADLLEIEPTTERWVRRMAPPKPDATLF
jgi:putative SOS response-associated peptidase YedK